MGRFRRVVQTKLQIKMEKITEKEFLKRCANSDASSNINPSTKEIVRSEIFLFDYYVRGDETFSVANFEWDYLIIASNKDTFQICAINLNENEL